MVEDARFEDGGERPLRVLAQDAEDLQILSGLVQDAVLQADDMAFDRKRRSFALLINRFRWEDRGGASGRPERVRAVLEVADVMHVATQGIDRADTDLVLSLLALRFDPGEDGTGQLVLLLAGDGEILLEVETLSVRLADVTRPYIAPSGKRPQHD